MKSDHTYNYLLFFSAILFLLLFFVLSFYNRLAVDDLYYLGGYTEKGIWGCMRDLYMGYSARWAAYLFAAWVVSLNSFIFYQYVFGIVTLFFLLLIICLIIKRVFRLQLNIDFPVKYSWLFAIILTCCLFFTSYSTGETWFWLVSVCIYLWSIIISLTLFYVLMQKKNNIVQIALLVICSVFIGGASESFALVIIFLLVAYLFFSNTVLKKNFTELILEKRNLSIFTALCFLVISFAITMMAPGNEIRYGALPKADFAHLVWVQLKSFFKIIFIRTPLKLPYLLLFSMPWLVLGNALSPLSEKVKLFSFIKGNLKFLLLFTALVFIFLIPTSFVMAELGPDRSLSQVSFLIAFAFALLFFKTGYCVEIKKTLLQPVKMFVAVCAVAVLLFHVINQYMVTKEYAIAYDKRMHYLLQLKNQQQKETVSLNALPASGMLYSAEISTDTAYFANTFLEYGLHLPFSTKRKK